MQNLKIKVKAITAYIFGDYEVVDCSSSADFGLVIHRPSVKDIEFLLHCERIEMLRDAAKEQRKDRANREQQEDLPF